MIYSFTKNSYYKTFILDTYIYVVNFEQGNKERSISIHYYNITTLPGQSSRKKFRESGYISESDCVLDNYTTRRHTGDSLKSLA